MSVPSARQDPERRLYAAIAVVALVVIYLVAFVVSNSDSVSVSFVLFSGRISLIWVMLFSILVGIAIGVAIPRLTTRIRGRKRSGDAAAPGGATEQT